jgi:hypothetical protein
MAKSEIGWLGAVLTVAALGAAPADDPFEFFKPTVALSIDDRRQLDRSEPVARVIPSVDGEIAVFTVVPVGADGNRLVAWMRRIEELKRSSYVLAIGRMSDPPRIEDLAGLELDEEDMAEVRACKPGDCVIALSAEEMARLQHAGAGAAGEWKAGVQREFRRIVLQRARAYLTGGLRALAPYRNRGGEVHLAQRFSTVLGHSAFLNQHAPQLAEYLDRYPHAPLTNVESFLYWSKERLAGKPIISMTHVSILRDGNASLPDVLVAGRQVFATRYVNASLGLTAIVRDGPGTAHYLVYVNRSEVDVLERWFGGLVRWFAERRVRAEAADILRGLRTRLESGDPPGVLADTP